MRIHRLSLRCLLGIIACGVVVIGCESDNDNEPVTEAEVEDVSIYGTWKGIAGTGQVNVTLKLEPDSYGEFNVGGSLTWPGNDVRKVIGEYPYGQDNKAQLLTASPYNDLLDADYWNLTIKGNTMTGVADKHGGGTYAVSLTKG